MIKKRDSFLMGEKNFETMKLNLYLGPKHIEVYKLLLSEHIRWFMNKILAVKWRRTLLSHWHDSNRISGHFCTIRHVCPRREAAFNRLNEPLKELIISEIMSLFGSKSEALDQVLSFRQDQTFEFYKGMPARTRKSMFAFAPLSSTNQPTNRPTIDP